MTTETFLGDGLFASLDHGMVRLRAPRPGGDQIVYLEPAVLATFLHWLARNGVVSIKDHGDASAS